MTTLPSTAQAQRMRGAARLSIEILAELFGPRMPAIRLWNGETIPRAGESAFTLVLTHPGALRRMFLPPGELTLVEAFLRGDFDLEGDILAAVSLLRQLGALAPIHWLRLVRGVLALPRPAPSGPDRKASSPAAGSPPLGGT